VLPEDVAVERGHAEIAACLHAWQGECWRRRVLLLRLRKALAENE